MNVLISFLLGLSAGWVAERFYQTVVSGNDNGGAFDFDQDAKAEEGKTEANSQKMKSKPDAQSGDTVGEEKFNDLSQLKGVGPKLAQALDDLRIKNFDQLAAYSVDELLEKLKETGGRFTRPAIEGIVERAAMEVAGKNAG